MKLPANVSESTRKRNPELYGLGAVSPAKPKRSGQRQSQAANADKARGSFRVVVSIVGLRRIPLDDDNFIGSSCKYVRDAIAASLGLDDGDRRLKFQYGQLQTSGDEGLIVRIELMQK